MSLMVRTNMAAAHGRVTDFLLRFFSAVSSQDGSSLSTLFAISSNSPMLFTLSTSLHLIQDPSHLVKQSDKNSQFGDLILHFFRSLHNYGLGYLSDAYIAFEKFANAFIQEFRNWESGWALEALYVVAYEIRVLAEMADKELASTGKPRERLKGAGSFLMKVFGVIAVKGPKSVGALYVTCQLFKIYFKLGTVHLCRSVIRSIETARIFDFEEFPMRDKITYMFYTGRLDVFNENFTSADQKLSYALMHCDPRSQANIRMILKYLVPVKLSLGVLPKKELLEKHNILQYSDITEALIQGDVRLLRHALQKHEDEFLRSGVYLVLEKLELQVYQSLLKKIHNIQKKTVEGNKAHQLRLETIVKVVRWLEMDMDVDEVECMVAIMIHKNLVKGYFSHKSKVVVLSKQDPFPKLNGNPVPSSF